MADADADPGGESLDASPVPSPAHSPIAVDFDVSLLTFDDPDSIPSASDAGSAPLLTNEGAPAAFVQLETLPQRAFNRRALDAAEAAAACELDVGSLMFSRHPRLSIWDLRLVFPFGHAGSSAAIALRRGALLVAFPPMRAVLTATRCFVLLEEGADGDVALLQSQFRERSSGEPSHALDGKGAESERTPFPARVLAAMLDVTRESLTRELARIRRRVSRVSNLGTHDSTVVEIEETEALLAELTTLLVGSRRALARFNGYAQREAAAQRARAGRAAAYTRALTSRALYTARLTQSARTTRAAPADNSVGSGGAATTAADAASSAADAAPQPARAHHPPIPIAEGAIVTRSARPPLPLPPPPRDGGGGDGGGGGDSSPALVAALQDALDDFGLPVEALLSSVRSLQQTLAAAKSRVNIGLTQKGNEIVRFQVMLQLVMAALSACLVVSGFFGMNIDNGGCGPDGCHDWLAADHGYARFRWVTGGTTGLAVALAAALWVRIQRDIVEADKPGRD